MGKTSERLEAYQTQMSIYAEQHKIILASDVLDMIEQLQDDLKDDVEKVVDVVREDCYSMGFDESQTEIIIEDARKGGVK